MIKTDNNCNGCPECRHCGRAKDYTYTACDVCNNDITNENSYDGMCVQCAIDYIENNASEFLDYL